MLQNQFANYGDKMFDKDTAKIVRNHAFLGSIIMMLPLFGVDWIIERFYKNCCMFVKM